FAEDTASRLGRSSKIPPAGKQYLNLRLADNWPASKSGLASILQVEQTTSIFDLYETFIRVAQRLISTEPDHSVRLSLRSCLDKLDGIEDFRLEKLWLLLETDCTVSLPDADLRATDFLLNGTLGKGYATARRAIKKRRNINDVLTAALCLTAREKLP